MKTLGDGVVYLVGAGPGDPGLLTLAGAEALRRAAVVVYDSLANPALLALCPAAAERVYVGKSANQHTKTQDEINAILVEKGRAARERGDIVVRLKGGDPYVFGRGGEEAEALRQHGISFVVIPGVTAGIGAAAYAGIPVTHRDFASTMTFVTGHERAFAGDAHGRREETAEEARRVDYAAVAALGRAGGTLVFYMGVKSLPWIVEQLLRHGLEADTPAAVIRWGTRARQRTVVATLRTLADEVSRAGITAPAITVVGPVVRLREELNWFEERPLFGKRILVTRTRQQASVLAERLAGLGAEVIEAPTIEVHPPAEGEWPEIDRALRHVPANDWAVFTSANGVRATWERLRELGFDARHFGATEIAAIGAATAEALEEIGLVPDIVPERFTGEYLAKALLGKIEADGDTMRGKRFILLRADIARPALREALEAMGALVEDVAIYRTARPVELEREVTEALAEGVDWVTFTSASTARNLWDLLPAELRGKVAAARRASIGPLTTAAMKGVGEGAWSPTVEASPHDIEGLVAALLKSSGG